MSLSANAFHPNRFGRPTPTQQLKARQQQVQFELRPEQLVPGYLQALARDTALGRWRPVAGLASLEERAGSARARQSYRSPFAGARPRHL